MGVDALAHQRGHLRPLEIAGRIKIWSDREINPGVDWEREIVQHLDRADIILILVSAAYYNSAYIHEKEITRAIGRHERGEAMVLPVIVRPCHFLVDPVIGRLQVLPTDGKPVTDRRHWQNRDDAWLDVVAGVKKVINEVEKRENQKARERALNIAHVWRIKEPSNDQPAEDNNRSNKPRSYPARRYATLGLGVLALLLAVWLLPKMLGGGSDGVTPSHPVTTTEVKNDSIASLPATSRKSGFEMVSVRGGTFTMGSPVNEAGRYDDECQHRIRVDAFSIGKYEVTQADWREIMGDNPADHKNCDDCPVEQVSWDDIQDFLKKLNARYPGKNYRLPSEAEWEYAARGGSAGSNTYAVYSGGNDLNAVAWYSDNSNSQTHPVGTKISNLLGLYDMSGNVWEWCQDFYEPYVCDEKYTTSGQGGPVYRGGGAFYGAAHSRAANRRYGDPARRGRFLGFRLVSVPLQ